MEEVFYWHVVNISASVSNLCSDHFCWRFARMTCRSLVRTSASLWSTVASCLHLSALSPSCDSLPLFLPSLNQLWARRVFSHLAQAFSDLSSPHTDGSLRSIQEFPFRDGSHKASFGQTPISLWRHQWTDSTQVASYFAASLVKALPAAVRP